MEQNLSLSPKRCRIGILPAGGKNWIAGSIYLKNIIRALYCLSPSERPHLFVIMHTHSRWDYHMPELQGPQPKPCYYSYHSHVGWKERLWSMKEGLLVGKWPHSYEALLTRLRVHVLFPVCDSLGKNFPAPWIGWIPDFQHKHLPQFFSEDELRQRDHRFQRMVEEASHVVVSSEDAYKDLMRWFPIAKDRVSILCFPMIPDEQWYEERPASVVRKFHLPEKFLIFSSQFWTHKNHYVLFDVIRLLKQKGIEDIALVCTGSREDFRSPDHFKRLQSFMDEHNLKQHIYVLGLLERSDQIQLLRAAAAVVQPSLFEGWSSLVEDCRTLGKRIYVSDIPVHREQEPPQARFFNPHNAEELADLIARDWRGLVPGPNLEQEKQGREETARRAVILGRTFLQIVEKTRQSGNY